MEKDFNYSPYMDFNPQMQGMDMNNMYQDPIFNPIMQYEQGYTYYKFLCMQMEYKMKCKEYDMMCNDTNNKQQTNNKVNREIR